MIIQNENLLKLWISQLVEDTSDAEPEALAKYVIALIKKPLSEKELEKLCTEKLSVFLQSYTETFVTKLFDTLKTNDYTKQNFHSERGKVKLDASNSEENPEDVTAAEADELVLTNGESEHELKKEVPVEKEPAKKLQNQKTESESRIQLSSGRSREEKSLSRSTAELGSLTSKEDSRKQQTLTESGSSSGKMATVAPPPQYSNLQQPSSKPAPIQRKRISPPRASSAERKATAAAERRSSPPMRRRVVLGGRGGGRGGLGVQHHNQRHYRGRGTQGNRGAALSNTPRERSRSRSPHIHLSSKEKRPDIIDTRPSLRRHRCRDFHEKGFCMRGDTCPFDHGPDPVIVEDTALEKIVSGGSIFFEQSSSYGVNPPPPGVESSTTLLGKSMVVTEGYNPEAPALTTSSAVMTGMDFSVPPPPIPQFVSSSHPPQQQLIYPPGTAPPTAATVLPPPYATSAGLAQHRPAMQIQEPTTTIYGGGGPIGGGSHVGGGFGRGRGGTRFKPYTLANIRNPASRSLLVKKIPMELNTITQLDQHFGKFGQVTNIRVQYEGRPDTALVTFKTRSEAMYAYKSTEPIFNNRFIKVFWQNDSQVLAELEANGTANTPAEGTNDDSTELGKTMSLPTGPMGPRGLPRSFTKTFAKQQLEFKPKNLSSTEEEEAKPNKVENPATPKADAGKKLMELHRMKADLYAKLVDQQRKLLQKLQQQGTAEDPAQKRKLMEMLKKIEEQAKKTKAELGELGVV